MKIITFSQRKEKKNLVKLLEDFEKFCIYFYLIYLRKYPLVRNCTVFPFKFFFKLLFLLPKAIIFFQIKPKRFIKLKNYFVSAQSSIITIFDESKVETPKPEISPKFKKLNVLSFPHSYYKSPKIYLAKVSDALIFGQSNFVLVRDKVICHDLYNFKTDITREEKMLFNQNIDVKKTYVKINPKIYDYTQFNIPKAATFLDALSHNYAHWLTEILPRIASFCSLNKFKDIPIIVDYGLHQNIMQSLGAIVKKKRIVYLARGSSVINVKKLYLMSAAGYVPYEPRFRSYSGGHGIFCPNSLNLIRERVFSLIKKLPEKKYPEKIYLKRTLGYRNLENLKEIEQNILNKGYVTVEPEKLPFLEQVSIFKNAKYIIGVSGAAFANLIFASLNTKITILICEYKYTKYLYWQNIACCLNLKVNYILGKTKSLDKNYPTSSNFSVDPKLIL